MSLMLPKADIARGPNNCEVCGGHRHWEIRHTEIALAVCEHCGRVTCWDMVGARSSLPEQNMHEGVA